LDRFAARRGGLPARGREGRSNLRRALEADQLHLPEGEQRLLNLLNKLGRKKWNVHLRERYPHGEGVVKYLARYVRGGPLKKGTVKLTVSVVIDYDDQPKEEKSYG